jgi:hypothetical protein
MATQEIHLEVTRYLERLLAQKLLRHMSVDKAMIEVRQWVPRSKQLSDSDLRSLVLGFFLSHHVYLPADLAMYSDNSRAAELKDAVMKAINLAIDGVPIVENLTGKITISVKGLTASSKRGGPTVNVGWTGTLKTEITGGNFTLRNTMSRSGWSISLSYPKDTPVLDSTKVGAVFGEAGNAMASIFKHTLNLTDVRDLRPKLGLISGYMEPIADAIGVALGINARPKLGLSVSASVGSPTPAPGPAGKSGGIEGFLTLTYSW